MESLHRTQKYFLVIIQHCVSHIHCNLSSQSNMQASPFPSVLIWKSCHSPQHVITCFKAYLFCVCMDSFWGAAGTEGCILEDDVCFWRQLYLISQEQWLYIFCYSFSKILPEHDFSLWFLTPVFLAPPGVFPDGYGGNLGAARCRLCFFPQYMLTVQHCCFWLFWLWWT